MTRLECIPFLAVRTSLW